MRITGKVIGGIFALFVAIPVIPILCMVVFFSVRDAYRYPSAVRDLSALKTENTRLAQENTRFRLAALEGLCQGHVQAIWCESNRFTVIWPQTQAQP